ncbi:MAG: hypothetical protein PHS41_01995 [Victivallaceae bacterium]|nr:hypothetical protein [Victivallaceae bacterium]
MTWIAFLLLFASVFLHAGWNFLSKSSHPSVAFYSLMGMTAGLCWMPFAIYWHVDLLTLPPIFYVIFAISIAAEVLYCAGLAYGYHFSDISFLYPVGRSLPVLTLAGITTVFHLGKRPDAMALAGMFVIVCGCALMPLKSWQEFAWKKYWNKSTWFIVCIVVGTTTYTICDATALEILRGGVTDTETSWKAAVTYLGLLEFTLGLVMCIYVMFSPWERCQFRRIFLRTWKPHVAGMASSSAYALVLLAMMHVTNVTYVQAFRQMSLPLGMLLGVIFLKERCGIPRIIGITAIMTGLLLTIL